jgi:predicted PolB exonuclease-like 3'-5' exonuclease
MNASELSSILFLDIETAPQYPSFDECPEPLKKLWERKASNLRREENETPEDIYNRAGIYAEFGKIICISTGVLRFGSGGAMKLFIKSYYSDDESELLKPFAKMLTENFNRPEHRLCAHNGKEFDFPYMARRMLINGIQLPDIINSQGKKPWEIAHIDTMELWKFGDFKSYTPLNLLTYAFGIPTPKDDIDGSMVWSVYWNDHDLERIVNYCQKDVVALTNVFLKLKGLNTVSADNVEVI